MRISNLWLFLLKVKLSGLNFVHCEKSQTSLCARHLSRCCGSRDGYSWCLLLRNSFGVGRKPICKWIIKVQEEKLPPSAVNSRLWGRGEKGTQMAWFCPAYSVLRSGCSSSPSLSGPKHYVASCRCCSLCLKCFLPFLVNSSSSFKTQLSDHLTLGILLLGPGSVFLPCWPHSKPPVCFQDFLPPGWGIFKGLFCSSLCPWILVSALSID